MVWSGRPPGLYWQRNFVLLHAEGGDTSILVSPVAAANLTTVELLSVTLPDSGKTVVFAIAAIFGKTAAISAYLPDSGKPVQVFLARLEKLKKMLRFCVITQKSLEAITTGGSHCWRRFRQGGPGCQGVRGCQGECGVIKCHWNVIDKASADCPFLCGFLVALKQYQLGRLSFLEISFSFCMCV